MLPVVKWLRGQTLAVALTTLSSLATDLVRARPQTPPAALSTLAALVTDPERALPRLGASTKFSSLPAEQSQLQRQTSGQADATVAKACSSRSAQVDPVQLAGGLRSNEL